MRTETYNKANLITYKQKDKFSANAWENKGLIAPDTASCLELQLRIDQIIDRLIEIIEQRSTVNQLKNTLKDGLKLFNKNDFDTEEKEFIGEIFFEISNIIMVNISSDINKWLYGAMINNLLKLSEFKSEKIIETLRQPCINCGVELESHIMKLEERIPDISWIIAKCNNCKEVNLLSSGPDIKEIKFGNYEWLGTLSKEDYNYEQGLTRIRQIIFQKNKFHY